MTVPQLNQMNKLRYSLVFIVFFFSGIVCKAQVITTIAGDGTAGSAGDGGAATAARVAAPYGNAVDNNGNVYIADYGSAKVRRISRSGIITTFAGNGVFAYTGDGGPATAASIDEVVAVATDASHNVYIADAHSRVVRKVDASGIISTYAGNGTSGYSGDGLAATAAQLSLPLGVATDNAGNVYIADGFNNVIRKVNSAGVISTFAGTGAAGYAGDGFAASTAALRLPQSVGTDNSGNVYIGDAGNHVIRKVDASGIIYTIAGSGSAGYTGDGGPAITASISGGDGVAVDGMGNLFIADAQNNVIRKVDAAGIITTVAGNGFGAGGGSFSGGYTGDGGLADSAELNAPAGVAIDAIGNLYIADHDNNAIRKVSAISGATHICIGGTVTLHVPVAGGVWASTLPSVANVGSMSGVVTGVGAGTAVIYYSIGSDTAATTVYVNATPTAGIISGTDSACVGTNILVTETMPGGRWSLSNTSALLTGQKVSASASCKDTVLYTVIYTCGAATAQFPVTFIQANAGTITGPHIVCLGDTLILTDTAAGGVWTADDPARATMVAPGVVKTIAPGGTDVSYSVVTTIPGCSDVAFFSFRIDTSAHCHQVAVTSVPTTDRETKIYPNPSDHIFNLEMSPINDPRTITLCDMYGRAVMTTTVAAKATKTELNVNAPAGVYMLRIDGGGKSEIHRIVVVE